MDLARRRSPVARVRRPLPPPRGKARADELLRASPVVGQVKVLVRPRLAILSAEECLSRLLHGFNIAAANLFRSNTDVVPASAYENKRLQCPPRANAAIDPL
jgi:hypothetical protein